MNNSVNQNKKFWEFALKDWPIKIICLVFAFIIFLFYRRSTLVKRHFSVPLRVESTSDFVVASSIPSSVKVTLWGDAVDIASINENDVEVYLDVSAYDSPGKFKAPIKSRISGDALNVEPLDIKVEPRAWELVLEKSASKKIPVFLSLKGTVAKSYEVSQTTVEPSTVLLTGPKSIISKLENISTEAILLENRSASFYGKVKLVNPDSSVRLPGDGHVEYSVKISEKIITKELKNLSAQIKNLSPELKIDTPLIPVLVTISGKEDLLSTFTPPEDFITIDCVEITEPGEYNLKVLTNPEKGIKVTTIFPDTLSVNIVENDEIDTKTLNESERSSSDS